QTDPLAHERFADAPQTVAVADLPIVIHLPHRHVNIILRRRWIGLIRSRTAAIAMDRTLHLQCFVRTNLVVNLPPLIKLLLRVAQIPQASPTKQFGVERAMKTFLLALGLRMIRPSMTDGDAVQQEPHFQQRVTFHAIAAVAPRPAIVTENTLRLAVTLKRRD